jgi:serine/threonine-protein kinase
MLLRWILRSEGGFVVAANLRVGQAFGKYRITGLLGRGGMGDVYEARDTSKDRTVALKILPDQYSQDDRFRARFIRESRAAAVLQEPHVIPIHDWGEIDGCLFIDMRLVQGQTLHDLLKRGPLDPTRAVSIVSQVAAALDSAHAAGLIHRDVKPHNIVVTPDDFPYLVDFGIASAIGESGLTMTGTQVGTYNYMAPERFGNQPATAAVDVYALACVLYECLTGDTPFATDSVEQAIAAHISSPPPRPSAVNPHVQASFDDVIARGMAKDPDDRYGSTGALGRAAKRALEGSPSTFSAANTMQASGFPSGSHYFTDPGSERPTDLIGGPPQWRQDGRSSRWVMPTVIAVAATLLLGAIGVVIGLLANQNSGPVASQSPSTLTVPAQTSYQTGSPEAQSSAPVPSLAPVPPPMPGPDQSALGERCEEGFVIIGATGFGTHSRRGSPDASCRFTQSVLDSYWAAGSATRDMRTVSAPGAVSCLSVLTDGRGCDGYNFLMQCVAEPGQAYITCTGGRNARVYLY